MSFGVPAGPCWLDCRPVYTVSPRFTEIRIALIQTVTLHRIPSAWLVIRPQVANLNCSERSRTRAKEITRKDAKSFSQSVKLSSPYALLWYAFCMARVLTCSRCSRVSFQATTLLIYNLSVVRGPKSHYNITFMGSSDLLYEDDSLLG
jgi:hypothetical protein